MSRALLCTVTIVLATGFALGQMQGNTLWNFGGYYNGDGAGPTSRLIFDAAGNLYGTTTTGGRSLNCDPNYGCGTVFELSPNSDGSWPEQALCSFGSPAYPQVGLVMDHPAIYSSLQRPEVTGSFPCTAN
jgi:uncharacterized repeat protein (TIGR03803 family)